VHHPEHYHGFAQVWFILKGAFTIDGRLCPPGTMLHYPDPHFEGAFQTSNFTKSFCQKKHGTGLPGASAHQPPANFEKWQALAALDLPSV
jgi:hypothetical protein